MPSQRMPLVQLLRYRNRITNAIYCPDCATPDCFQIQGEEPRLQRPNEPCAGDCGRVFVYENIGHWRRPTGVEAMKEALHEHGSRGRW